MKDAATEVFASPPSFKTIVVHEGPRVCRLACEGTSTSWSRCLTSWPLVPGHPINRCLLGVEAGSEDIYGHVWDLQGGRSLCETPIKLFSLVSLIDRAFWDCLSGVLSDRLCLCPSRSLCLCLCLLLRLCLLDCLSAGVSFPSLFL